MAWTTKEYEKEIEQAFWNGGGRQGFAFAKVAEFLSILEGRIEHVEDKIDWLDERLERLENANL